MTDQHPITPPPELVGQWMRSVEIAPANTRYVEHIATQAARWGADQELEACCADIYEVFGKRRADWLRSARRPEPPSLKEQALAVIENSAICDHLSPEHAAILLRAVEQLDD